VFYKPKSLPHFGKLLLFFGGLVLFLGPGDCPKGTDGIFARFTLVAYAVGWVERLSQTCHLLRMVEFEESHRLQTICSRDSHSQALKTASAGLIRLVYKLFQRIIKVQPAPN